MNDDAATEATFMREAIALSLRAVESGAGGPFGAVVVKDGRVVGRGHNRVVADQDPTAHAEMLALREAARTLGTFQLEGCTIYTSCEPCPMCLGAIYWARLDRIVYANTREDAAAIGFDDEHFHDELARPANERTLRSEELLRDEARAAFELWTATSEKTEY